MNRYFKEIVGFDDYYISKKGTIFSKKSNKYINHNGNYVTLVHNKKKYVRSLKKIIKNTFDDYDDKFIEYDEDVYRYIKGFKENYAIDKNGNILSIKRGKLRTKFINPYGYDSIFLSKNGKTYFRFIHRLVYESWIGDIPEGMTIGHIDENKLNNNVNNLQIISRSESVLNFHNENNKKNRTPEGFVKINGYDNYYINNDGVVISFKYGDKYHNISESQGGVFLRKDGKRYRITVKYLLNKYFNQKNKLFNKNYKNG